MTRKDRVFRLVSMIVISLFLVVGFAVTASSDDLIGKYEPSDRKFTRVEIGDKIVYFHQRMIDNAIVEKDFIVYQFDKNTEELIDKKVYWRSDLPEHVTINVDRAQTESLVEGEIQSIKLYIISPDSDVFPLDPTPENPCWVVRSIDNDKTIVTIFDAVTGEKSGYGVPPPSGGFSLSGPQYWNPCSGIWTSWYQNAESWFNTMGYPTEAVQWPTEAKVQGHVQNPNTSLFYELAHGGSYSFASGCVGGNTDETTYASEIETWIAAYRKMPFTFIGSCGGMCDTSDNSLSYEFRKGSTTDTTTVGYCGMADAHCGSCWTVSVDWQDTLFDYMNQGMTVKSAFDNALADYPQCASAPSCMRFAGDPNFKVVVGYDFCFEDGGWRKEFDIVDGFWLVGEGSNSSCGRSDLLGWVYGNLYALNWDIVSGAPCVESILYFGHVSNLSYHWLNTSGGKGTGTLLPCSSAFPESEGSDETQSQGAGVFSQEQSICLVDNYGYVHTFTFDGYYLEGQTQTTSCGTVPLLGAVEGNVFSWYTDVPTGTGTCLEGMLYGGLVSSLSGVWMTAGNFATGSFSLTPCPDLETPSTGSEPGPLESK